MARKPAPPKLVVGDDDDADKNANQSSLEVIDADDDQGSLEHINGNAASESADELRSQLETANARATRAEAAAAEARRVATNATRSSFDSDKAAIENAIGNAEATKRELLSQIVTAKEAGDYKTEAELTDKLQQANIKVSRLNEGKNEIERRIEDEKNPTIADPVEAYVNGMAPRSANWIREHRDTIVDANGQLDPRKMRKVEDAHFDALDEKLTPGTRSYFNFIEKQLGLGGGGVDDEPRNNNQQEDRPVRREQSAPAAPVSRTQGNGGNRLLPAGVEQLGDGRYKLSEARREAARVSGQTDTEYLENLLAIERDRANGTIN
jgi:hypothetical protein